MKRLLLTMSCRQYLFDLCSGSRESDSGCLSTVFQLCIRKGKGPHVTCHADTERAKRYRYLILTWALEDGGWSAPRHGRFTPGKKPRYPLYSRLGGPQDRSRRVCRKESLFLPYRLVIPVYLLVFRS